MSDLKHVSPNIRSIVGILEAIPGSLGPYVTVPEMVILQSRLERTLEQIRARRRQENEQDAQRGRV